jgi:hypothetical protein
MSFLFSIVDNKGLSVILLSLSSSFSESFLRRSWFQCDMWLCSNKLHGSHICSYCARQRCPSHWISRNFCLPLLVFHQSSRAGMAWIHIFHLPLVMTRKTHDHEFHWGLWLVPDCLHCHIWQRILFWKHSCRYCEPVHEWIGNSPVPKDKPMMQWRGSSGETFAPAIAWRIGPML